MRGAQAALTMAVSDGKQHFWVHLHSNEASLRSVVDSHRPDSAPRHKTRKGKDQCYAVRDEHQFVLVTNYWWSSGCLLRHGDYHWEA